MLSFSHASDKETELRGVDNLSQFSQLGAELAFDLDPGQSGTRVPAPLCELSPGKGPLKTVTWLFTYSVWASKKSELLGLLYFL